MSYWNNNYGLEPDEIAPWKLPRDKHATISVITHKQKDFAAIDSYLSECEQQYKIEYIKRLGISTEQAWENAMKSLNARFHKRGKNIVLECLQFGGNKEFWDEFPSEEDIAFYFRECYAYAIRKIGFLRTHENIVCAVIITEPNRWNLFVYYLPVRKAGKRKS